MCLLNRNCLFIHVLASWPKRNAVYWRFIMRCLPLVYRSVAYSLPPLRTLRRIKQMSVALFWSHTDYLVGIQRRLVMLQWTRCFVSHTFFLDSFLSQNFQGRMVSPFASVTCFCFALFSSCLSVYVRACKCCLCNWLTGGKSFPIIKNKVSYLMRFGFQSSFCIVCESENWSCIPTRLQTRGGVDKCWGVNIFMHLNY